MSFATSTSCNRQAWPRVFYLTQRRCLVEPHRGDADQEQRQACRRSLRRHPRTSTLAECQRPLLRDNSAPVRCYAVGPLTVRESRTTANRLRTTRMVLISSQTSKACSSGCCCGLPQHHQAHLGARPGYFPGRSGCSVPNRGTEGKSDRPHGR